MTRLNLNQHFHTSKTLGVWLLLLLTGGCSSNLPPSESRINNTVKTTQLYCARYLIYDLCAIDLDHNGSTDALYFDDTKEVFMYDLLYEARVLTQFDMHPCAQIMDDGMKAASTQILTIQDDTPFLEKLSIQKTLIEQYSRYTPKVRACKESFANSLEEEDFGDSDDWDF